MKYFNIPVVYATPTDEQVDEFLAEVVEPLLAGSAAAEPSPRREQRILQQTGDRHRPDAAGHGRDHARFLRHFFKCHIADKTRAFRTRRVVDAIDADVEHDGAWLDPIALDERGSLAHCGVSQPAWLGSFQIDQ